MSDGRKYYCFCEANCKFETMTKEQILAAIAQAAENGLVFDTEAAFITKVKEGNAGSSLTFWLGTQAQYNAAVATNGKDPLCYYILTDCDTPAELTAKVKDLQQSISTLTAADVGAAPADYGLGTGGVYPNEAGLNGPNLARGGFFRWDSLGQSNGYPFVYGTMLVVPRVKDSSSFMLAYCHADSYKGTIAVKQYASGAETQWEYINPPMALGAEYLTTERYNGKPVYIKASELDLSASGSKFAHIYPSISNVVSIDGSVYKRGDGTIVPIAVYASNITINMYGNFIWNVTENSLAYIIVKYTKQ